MLSQNEFSNEEMLNRGDEPTALDDATANGLRLEADRTFRLLPSKEFWFDVLVDLARHNTFHPPREYFDDVQGLWDGKPRLDTWLIDHAGAGDTPFVRAVSAITLIAAVRRVRQPGCEFQEMTVLESAQGWGKSKVWRLLAGDAWFFDGLNLKADAKKVLEQNSGHLLIERADLSGLREAHVEHLKQMMSMRVNKARMSYDRLRTDRPRRFIFVGTTNETAYLLDPTGNRRFWPIAIKRRIDLAALAEARDQLWAEAATREARGESIRLASELWEAAAEEQRKRLDGDGLDDFLGPIFEGTWAEDNGEEVGPALEGKIPEDDMWLALGGVLDRRHKGARRKLIIAMQKLGFKEGRYRFGTMQRPAPASRAASRRRGLREGRARTTGNCTSPRTTTGNGG